MNDEVVTGELHAEMNRSWQIFKQFFMAVGVFEAATDTSNDEINIRRLNDLINAARELSVSPDTVSRWGNVHREADGSEADAIETARAVHYKLKEDSEKVREQLAQFELADFQGTVYELFLLMAAKADAAQDRAAFKEQVLQIVEGDEIQAKVILLGLERLEESLASYPALNIDETAIRNRYSEINRDGELYYQNTRAYTNYTNRLRQMTPEEQWYARYSRGPNTEPLISLDEKHRLEVERQIPGYTPGPELYRRGERFQNHQTQGEKSEPSFKTHTALVSLGQSFYEQATPPDETKQKNSFPIQEILDPISLWLDSLEQSQLDNTANQQLLEVVQSIHETPLVNEYNTETTTYNVNITEEAGQAPRDSAQAATYLGLHSQMLANLANTGVRCA